MKFYKGGKLHEDRPGKPMNSSQAKAYDHDRQRREHKADIVQPYNSDGSLSADFAWLYPEQYEIYRSKDGES